MNVGYLLTNSANKVPEQTAIISDQSQLTFSEFEIRTAKLADAMLKAGLKKGERAAILFFNGSYFAEAYFAAVRAGIVAVPINFRLSAPEIAFILNDSRPGILFYGPQFEEALLEIREQIETVNIFVSPENEGSRLAIDFESFLRKGHYPLSAEGLTEDDRCQIMYTSGTTGRPKGAVLTHGNVIWNFFNTVLGRDDFKGEKAIIAGPLYHAAALNNHLTIQIALGGTSIIMSRFDPESMLRLIEREKVTVVSGSPALFNMLLNYPSGNKFDTGSVAKCTTGSDKLPTVVKEGLLDFFPNIEGVYDVYGCTEASPCIAILKGKDSLTTSGSVGKALPFLHVRIVDEEGTTLPAGEVGELICKGPNVMQGYYGDMESTSEAIINGWLYTGDLAKMDELGYIYIVDRKDDMIISGGENIYPREVEDTLLKHPSVLDAAVIGMPDPGWGESVKAFIVKKEGSLIDEEGLIKYCRTKLAGYKKPRKVVFVSSIPRNPSGKALKRVLRQI